MLLDKVNGERKGRGPFIQRTSPKPSKSGLKQFRGESLFLLLAKKTKIHSGSIVWMSSYLQYLNGVPIEKEAESSYFIRTKVRKLVSNGSEGWWRHLKKILAH